MVQWNNISSSMSIPEFLKLTVPKSNTHVPIKRSEGEFVYFFLKNRKIKKTLEIGFGYGFSTTYIIAATESDHYVIDPDQVFWYKNYGKRNLKNFSLLKYLKLLEEKDYIALPKILGDKKFFDFIFIDGDHKFDSIFLDFFYADLLLNKGGYIIFHDAWMRSTQLVVSWIKKNKENYRQIKCSEKNLIVLEKSENERYLPWDFFNEFYNLKSLLIFSFYRIFKKIPY